ncbi:MAG: ankyrin repeat domain-containing protein, partial [Clostridium sp.]|nr:ankyrin repeat domain-containing protein [Clostridium sp.]
VPGVFELPTYLDEDTLDLITSGNLNLVKDAIKSGVDINDTYILGDALYAQTILYYYIKFAKRNSEAIVKWLLENGADPNIPSANGLTPLYTAIFHKEHGITDLLLKNGADPDKKPESRENTPLTIACMRQNKPGIELLLKYGADPNKPNKYGETPIAIVSNDDDDNTELVELLVKYGAKLD